MESELRLCSNSPCHGIFSHCSEGGVAGHATSNGQLHLPQCSGGLVVHNGPHDSSGWCVSTALLWPYGLGKLPGGECSSACAVLSLLLVGAHAKLEMQVFQVLPLGVRPASCLQF